LNKQHGTTGERQTKETKKISEEKSKEKKAK
jgi:hypothetical protein